MNKILSAHQSKEIDRLMIEELQIPGIVLMEQAATAVANAVCEMCEKNDRILCICGGGNNGGDGWAAARILLTRGYNVTVGATTLDLPRDAAANAALFSHTCHPTIVDASNIDGFFSANNDAAVIIDALFGIGLSREPGGIYKNIIEHINDHSAKVVSVDIPSGVFCDNGHCTVGVNADVCVTFQYTKLCHHLFPGRAHTGRLVLAPIGVLAEEPASNVFLIDGFRMPPRKADANKGSFGRLGIIAGSRGMSGAAVMSARAAISSGAGLTTVLTCGFTVGVLQNNISEVMARDISTDPNKLLDPKVSLVDLSGFSAIAIGMGLGNDPSLFEFISKISKSNIPKVIDADALNILSADSGFTFGDNTVVTPHPKEFSRLSGESIGEILGDPINSAMAFAKARNTVVLLKGATTVVADGEKAYLITRGTPAMAKGGSGDVLSGIVGSFLAQGLPCEVAAYGAAYCAGAAGEAAAAEKGEYSPTANDTIRHLRVDK